MVYRFDFMYIYGTSRPKICTCMMLYSYEHAFILLQLHFTALKQNSFFLITVFCYLVVASLAHAVHQGCLVYKIWKEAEIPRMRALA